MDQALQDFSVALPTVTSLSEPVFLSGEAATGRWGHTRTDCEGFPSARYKSLL